MEMLLDGNDMVLSLLRKQYEHAQIVSMKRNNVGFYVDYKVDKFAIEGFG